MYSEEIQEKIEEKNIEAGDLVKVDGKKGRLMPKPESGDPETLVIKLENGYNIGIKPNEIQLLEKTEIDDEKTVEVPFSEEKPDILVLHTGGTIASRVSYEEGGVKPAFDPEDLIEMYPELSEICNIHSEVIAQMLSEDMEPEHWIEIAERIDEVKDEYDGIIVGHGTDTMGFTGAALSLMLKGIDKGVILVGSQRSSDRPSSDAATNLFSAVKFLNNSNFTGIAVSMHGTSSDSHCDIMPADKIRKMHTSRRDAFETINTEKIGEVDIETGEIQNYTEKKREKDSYELTNNLETEVGFLKVRPGMKTDQIDFLLEQDYEGVIIEGTGLGHMPVNSFDENTEHHQDILEKISELAEDTVVVMSSNCINGRINMDVYDAGYKIKETGVLSAKDMHPELAYVKLMWSLGQANTREEAEELFQQNINGETKKRSVYSG